MFIVMVSAKNVRSVVDVPTPGWTIEVQTGSKRVYYDFLTVDSAERIVYHERRPQLPEIRVVYPTKVS